MTSPKFTRFGDSSLEKIFEAPSPATVANCHLILKVLLPIFLGTPFVLLVVQLLPDFMCAKERKQEQLWKPNILKPAFLAFVVLSTASLLVTVIVLYIISSMTDSNTSRMFHEL